MIAYGDRDKDILSHILEYCKQIDEFLLRYENNRLICILLCKA